MSDDLRPAEIARILSELRADVLDHETRLRAVERWIAALPPTLVLGVATAAGTIVGAVVAR